jgi:hypothetical protein
VFYRCTHDDTWFLVTLAPPITDSKVIKEWK